MTIIIPDVITNKVLTLRVYQGWSVLNNVEVQELVWLFFISSLNILRMIPFIWHIRVKLVLLKENSIHQNAVSNLQYTEFMETNELQIYNNGL